MTPKTTPPTAVDVNRMKRQFALKHGGSTPPPPHVRKFESALAKAAAKGSR